MTRRPPISTRTDTRLPYTTHFRAQRGLHPIPVPHDADSAPSDTIAERAGGARLTVARHQQEAFHSFASGEEHAGGIGGGNLSLSPRGNADRKSTRLHSSH